jgi:hypothetical protein
MAVWHSQRSFAIELWLDYTKCGWDWQEGIGKWEMVNAG